MDKTYGLHASLVRTPESGAQLNKGGVGYDEQLGEETA